MKISQFLAGLLIVGISFSANASGIKIEESIKGKKAQEMLNTLTKKTESTPKIQQNTKKPAKNAKGGEYPYNNDVIPPFNATTDSLLALKDDKGDPILFVAYTTHKPVATIGEKVVINPKLENKVSGEKAFYVQEWDSETKKLEGRNVNAYEYYNGGHNFNASYTEWGMPHSNSFGMWIKLNARFSNDITLFSRNENYTESGGYRPDYFHFRLLSNGKLSVTSKITDYSVDSLTTTKSIPLDKWVYIQATQNLLNYQIGWKAQDGSDEELVSKVFDKVTLNMRDCDPNSSCSPRDNVQRNRLFDLQTFVESYVNNEDFRNYINIKEVFYNPDIEMFALMNNYNSNQTFIGINNGFVTYPLNTIIQESYNVLTGGTSSILKYEDIDIYYDPNTKNIVLIDWRINRQGANK